MLTQVKLLYLSFYIMKNRPKMSHLPTVKNIFLKTLQNKI